jgi:hypothetical protein
LILKMPAHANEHFIMKFNYEFAVGTNLRILM